MSEPAIVPEQTLVIVFGASEWPKAGSLPPSRSFAQSAQDFATYLLSPAPHGFGLAKENLLNLFDADEEAVTLLDHISDFMQQRRKALEESNRRLADLVVYYVGHGGIDSGSSDEFYFTLRRTREHNRLASSLSVAHLARTLKSVARGERKYLILDCCFAAAATEAFVPQSQFADALQKKVRMEFPARGTALLCAASAADRARAPKDSRHTMFSGALIDVLQKGYAAHRSAFFSLEGLYEAITLRIRELYEDPVRPEVHNPDQLEGRLSHIPIFRNPAIEGTADVLPVWLQAPPPGPPALRLVTAPKRAKATPPRAEAATSVPDGFAVVAVKAGDRKISAIRTVRDITGLGLKEAKELVETVPCPVVERVSRADAARFRQMLESSGMRVKIVRSGRLPAPTPKTHGRAQQGSRRADRLAKPDRKKAEATRPAEKARMVKKTMLSGTFTFRGHQIAVEAGVLSVYVKVYYDKREVSKRLEFFPKHEFDVVESGEPVHYEVTANWFKLQGSSWWCMIRRNGQIIYADE